MDDPFGNSYAGIYYNPRDTWNVKLFRDKMLFLRAAAEHVPDFAASLFRHCIPVLNERFKGRGSIPKWTSAELWNYDAQFAAAAQEWAREFRIEVDWVVQEATEIVVLGLTYVNRGIEPIEAFGSWRRRLEPNKNILPFQPPAWDAQAESEADYKRRATKAWEKARDDHIAATKSDLSERGMVKIAARRNGPKTDKHLEWAALHQCGRKSIYELADQYLENTETIRISVTRILKPLGFELPT